MEKISLGQAFKVYVLIPMYPEGIPDEMSVQEMLHWQYLTMDSMYRRIACAIRQFGAKSDNTTLADPTDYLSFYCLAKQESPGDQPESLQEPRPGSDAGRDHNVREAWFGW